MIFKPKNGGIGRRFVLDVLFFETYRYLSKGTIIFCYRKLYVELCHNEYE